MKSKTKKLVSILLIFTLVVPVCLPENLLLVHATSTYDTATVRIGDTEWKISADPYSPDGRPINISLTFSDSGSEHLTFPTKTDLLNALHNMDSYSSGQTLRSIQKIGTITLVSCSKAFTDAGIKTIQFTDDYTTIPKQYLRDNTTVQNLIFDTSDSLTLEEYCFSNMSALQTVQINAKDITFTRNTFSQCSALTTVQINGPATFITGYNFSDCGNLSKVTFSSSTDSNSSMTVFEGKCDFGSSFTNAKTSIVTFNNPVKNVSTVFSNDTITTINLNGKGNELNNYFVDRCTITNFNIEKETTLNTNCIYGTSQTNGSNTSIAKFSVNAPVHFGDNAITHAKIDNFYFNVGNGLNNTNITFTGPNQTLGCETIIKNLHFNYLNAGQQKTNIEELKNIPLGTTSKSSLNIDQIYFYNPDMKYIGGSDYNRPDGNTSVYGYGGAIAYDDNGNLICSYDMYQNWIKGTNCTFVNMVQNVDYTINSRVYLTNPDQTTYTYDFASDANLTVYASYKDNQTPYENLNQQLANNNNKLKLSMITGSGSTNFNYRILEKASNVTGLSKNEYICQYEGAYYKVLTDTKQELTEGVHEYLLEVGGEKTPFRIIVKRNQLQKITKVTPASGDSLQLNYGDTVTKDMLKVYARFTNGEEGYLDADSYEIENAKISAPANGNYDNSGTEQVITLISRIDAQNTETFSYTVYGYPVDIVSYSATCLKDDIPEKTYLTTADVALTNVTYCNPSTPVVANATDFHFYVDGKETDSVQIAMGTNRISLSYKGIVLSNALVVEGRENTITRVVATYTGFGVYEACQVPISDVQVYVYKDDGTNEPTLITDSSLITLGNYLIAPNQNNKITVSYKGHMAEAPIVVPGLKDIVGQIDVIQYNGLHTIGSTLNVNDFYIELLLLSGKRMDSKTYPEILNNITLSATTLTDTMNIINVIYNGNISKTIPITAVAGSNETTSPLPTATVTPTVSPVITPTAEPSATPSIVTDPSVPLDSIPTAEPTVTPSATPTVTPTASPAVKKIKKGSTYSISNVTYKVLSFNGKSGTVSITGYKKTAKSVSVKTSVKINGHTFKVVSIAKNAFKNCTKLKGTIRLDGNISSVGANAFYGCKKITKVIIGKNVKTLGSKSFYKCSNLVLIDLYSANKLTKIGSNAFKKNGAHRRFKVKTKNKSKFLKILKGKY